MTEPDEALLWAMKQPESLALPVIRMAQGYRAGQAASAERIKALEEALSDLLVAVTYTAPPVDFGTPDDPNPGFEARIPVDFVNIARAALAKEADQ